MSDDINIGAISEALNNKLDISCMNANPATTPAGLNTHNMPVIITTYVNGTSGYRIWADGFCEQWGRSSGSTGYYINLMKPFANTNYNITTVRCTTNTGTSGGSTDLVGAVATDKFWIDSTNSNYTYWRACGYLAPDQY